MSRVKRDCRCARVRHEHGTEAAYTCDDCRCLPCALARQAYTARPREEREELKQTIPVLGTRRRLQALTALGWSPPELSARCGLNHQIIARLRDAPSERRVLRTTAATVEELYRLLAFTPATGAHRKRLANLAARKGYVSALAWDDIDDPNERPHARPRGGSSDLDEIAVAEAMHGRRVRLTRAERSEVVRRLTDQGLSLRQIAERLDTTPRSVQRRRSAA